ncbi:MAG TPA: Gfo/Idh/MocA family oxidoreductase [Bacteroidetes bacterium]|nr:Gfo/Idh/MocA family oxidoreductase [Bacteroidota bacterium]
MKKYNWGIIGPGKIAHKFTRGLKQLDNATLYSVVSRSMERAKDFAQEYGYLKSYDDYLEFASDPELDIVYVATPHSHHYEHTMICLRNGKAVLCEKAFAANSARVDQMINAATENKIFLMEALWPPFQPSYKKAGEIISAPATGPVQYIISRFAFKAPYDPEARTFNPGLAGGSLLDIGIYPVIDALTFLGKPDRIETNTVFAPTGVDKSIGILFGYKDGRGASLYSSFANDGGTGTLIICENANISISRSRDHIQHLEIEYASGEKEAYTYRPVAMGFHYEAAEVMRCLDMGLKESPVVPLSFSRDLIRTLDRIRKRAGIIYPPEVDL